jgi:OmcA/MtrC family decaheme c-type cytochrome
MKRIWITVGTALWIAMALQGAETAKKPSNPSKAAGNSRKVADLSVAEAAFIRPGLAVRIMTASIGQDGVIRARVRLTDPRGLPLDRLGIDSAGPIAVSLVAAYIPKGQRHYTAYTTRVQTSPITGRSATQAGSDTGGTFEKVAEGEYLYTFQTRVPAGADRSASHTIGAYATRDLREFDLDRQFADTTFNFVPDGSPVRDVRDVVKTASCNQCHNPISAHGGPRKSMELCVLCHQPQTTDPDTGNTVDMTVMTHKIHMGSGLPSVKAGKPYQIIGNAQSMHDFSDVVFPPDARNCTVCHQQTTSAVQQTNHLNPNREACGSCHDNVNFATGEGHVNMPQVSDNQCSRCHTPEGELEFDASIKGAHTIPRFSRELPGTVFDILKVDDAAPGKRPTVTFTLKNKKGEPLLANALARLGLVLAGSTFDYGAYFAEDARSARGDTQGVHTYTFTNPIPADATGSFSVGIEGYNNATLMAGTTQQMTLRDAGVNIVKSFSIDGSPLMNRRTVVTTEKCNSCHFSLSLHGDNRNKVEQCVLCHNPNENDRSRRPAVAGAPQSVNFATMVHKIHTGKELTSEYTVYGFGGTPFDFTKIGYPGDRRDCTQCHVNGSENLPLAGQRLTVKDPRGLLSEMGPATAACTSCHTSRDAISHALANTSALGESCAACHGANSEFSVSRVHAR